MPDLVARLRKHDGGTHQQCTCHSRLANCTACDCFLAAREIERLRDRLAKIENAPVEPGNTVAMTLKRWAAPRDGDE